VLGDQASAKPAATLRLVRGERPSEGEIQS